MTFPFRPAPAFRPVLASLLVLSVLGNTPLVSANPFEKALSATVRLTSNGVSGTGFVVQKGEETILVTAAHVFQDLKGDHCDFVYRKKREGGSPVRESMPLTIRKDEEPLWKKHGKQDIAMIEISIPDDAVLTPILFSDIATAGQMDEDLVEVGDEVCIPCYPVGTEANPAGWPVLRRGTVATHPLAPVAEAETFFIDASSFGGESGAPVIFWTKDTWHLIGIVTSMQRQTDRTVTPLEERVTHLPLGLGIAVQAAFLHELLTE